MAQHWEAIAKARAAGAYKDNSGALNNEGGRIVPKEYANLQPDFADKVMNQHAAFSTYFPNTNETAFEHLKTAISHVDSLAEHMPGNDHVQAIQHKLREAANAHANYDNDAALSHLRGAASTAPGELPEYGAQGHLKVLLRNASMDNNTPKYVSLLASKANDAVNDYLHTFHPANIAVPNRQSKDHIPGTVAVGLEPEYREAIDEGSKYHGDRITHLTNLVRAGKLTLEDVQKSGSTEKTKATVAKRVAKPNKKRKVAE